MTKILIVEDDTLNLKLFCDLLLTRKYSLLTSKDGVGVTSLVISEQPDLILMDIKLNGVSGLSGMDLIKELKSDPVTSNIPIIAITAFAMKQDEVKIMDLGCDMYISKPFLIKDFFQGIDRFISDKIVEVLA